MFLKESAAMLLKYMEINTYAIDLEEGKQPFYRLIYSQGPIELETLKIYIETNFINDFIHSSKFSASFQILFNKK